eukprot:7115959-Karenia_brevis.AAC.1
MPAGTGSPTSRCIMVQQLVNSSASRTPVRKNCVNHCASGASSNEPAPSNGVRGGRNPYLRSPFTLKPSTIRGNALQTVAAKAAGP